MQPPQLRQTHVSLVPVVAHRCERWLEEIEVRPTGQELSDTQSSTANAPLDDSIIDPSWPRSPVGPAASLRSWQTHPTSANASTLVFAIPKWSYAQDPKGRRVVVYHVTSRRGAKVTETAKRYSSFVLLDHLLQYQHHWATFTKLRSRRMRREAKGAEPPAPPPTLPPRRWWPPTNRRLTSITERCLALERYLQAIGTHPRAAQLQPLLLHFLQQEEPGQPLIILSTTQLSVPAPVEALQDTLADDTEPATGPEGGAVVRDARKLSLVVGYPEWVLQEDCWNREFPMDHDRMSLCIAISEKNVQHNTGGPFGAAIFEADSGRVVALGISLVDLQQNCCLHAETVAIQMAISRLGTKSLDREGSVRYELFATSEPCAMCIGAILWSGVSRLVCAATDVDVRTLLHDTGPVFEDSFKYLRSKGVTIERKFLRMEAKKVISDYSADHASMGRQI